MFPYHLLGQTLARIRTYVREDLNGLQVSYESKNQFYNLACLLYHMLQLNFLIDQFEN